MGIFSVNLLFSDLQYIQKLLACTGGGGGWMKKFSELLFALQQIKK